MTIMVKKTSFRQYYSSLKVEEKRNIRNKFLEVTGLSYPGFFSKIQRGNFQQLEQKAIEEICNREFIW